MSLVLTNRKPPLVPNLSPGEGCHWPGLEAAALVTKYYGTGMESRLLRPSRDKLRWVPSVVLLWRGLHGAGELIELVKFR